jgi:hypothetical protein
MAATYNVEQLATNAVYRVRYTIGDTDVVTEAMLQDEEIQFALDSKVDERKAAIMCCETITSRLAKKFDFKLGPSDNKISQQFKQYSEVLQRLKSENSSFGIPAYFNRDKAIFDIDMMNAVKDSHISEEE